MPYITYGQELETFWHYPPSYAIYLANKMLKSRNFFNWVFSLTILLLILDDCAPHTAKGDRALAFPLPLPIQEKQERTSVNSSNNTVIARIWHGRTLSSQADEYNRYLQQEGIEKILSIPGNLGAQVLRRTEGDVTEFTVISYWESLDAIRQFAGEDIEKARYLPRDREYLLELEPNVKHFNVVFEERKP